MMKRLFIVLLALSILIVQPAPQASAQLGDLLKSATKLMGGGGGGLSNATIIDGLKEALQIGSGNAVDIVSQIGGYLNNPAIKIPLPGYLEKAESILRATGFGSQLDAFDTSMNTAAETAAPQAKSIFWDSIKQMEIADAKDILNGPDDAATQYFKGKTWDQLHAIFKPIVNAVMGKVGVTRQYQNLTDSLSAVPFVDASQFDLDNHVTDGALDGLFHMLAQEEAKIRQDPTARVTDLLKNVFGKR